MDEFDEVAQQIIGSQDPLDQAAAGIVADQKTAVRSSLYSSLMENPDMVARSRQLGQKTGLPADVVSRNYEEVDRRAKMDDYDRILQESPVLAQWITDQNNSGIAHDNIENMSAIESVVRTGKKIGSAGMSGLFSASAGVIGLAQAPFELAAPLFDPLAGTILPENPMRRVASGLAEYRDRTSQQSANAMPQTNGVIDGGFYSGVASLSRNMAALPLAFAPGGQGAALTAMTAPIGGEEFSKARAAGTSPVQALTYGASQAAIEYATEKIPVSRLLGDLGAGSSFIKTLSRQIAAEVPGEQVATILQDLNEWAVLKPDASFKDYLAERPGAAAQTLIATIVGAGGQTSLMTGIDQIVNRQAKKEEKAQIAQQGVEALAELNKLAATDKLLQRSPESFQQFIEQAAEEGPVQNVYIDANTLMQSGVAEQLAQVSPAIAEQIQAAASTGGQIAIPVGEYAAKIAPTEFAQSLLDHLKVDPDGYSMAEVQAAQESGLEQEQAEEFEGMMQDRQADTTFQESADAVTASILTELNTVGRFSDQKNAADAMLFGSYYAVRAAQLGVTPEALYAKRGVKFAAESLGDREFNQGGEQVSKATIQAKSGENFNVSVSRETFGFGQTTPNAVLVEIHEPGTGHRRALIDFAVREDGTLTAENVKVAPAFQGKGLAESMYRAAAAAGYKIAPGRFQTEQGAGLVKRLQDKGVIGEGPINLLDSSAPPQGGVFNQDARGAFNAESLTISLMKGADLSTALHEGAHFFFENDIEMASEILRTSFDAESLTEGERQIVADVSALLTWHGYQGDITEQLGQWYTQDFEAKRAAHERTAESFEAYLFSGQAPSLELQPYFQKFRAWMLSVYKSLKDFLSRNPEAGKLDDTIRSVFDRMLASTEQIKQAEQARSMLPLFADLEKSGMSPEEFAEYHKTGIDASSDAAQELQARGLRDMQWLKNAKTKEIAKLKKKSEELRKLVRMELRREIMSQPVYRAWQFLTSKAEEGSETGKLSLGQLEANTYISPEGKELLKKRRMTARDGFDAEVVAESVVDEDGAPAFSSADQMLQELVSAPSPNEAIDAATDAKMLADHGELSTPDAIERAADQAIHNEARAKFIATEANALSRAIGKPQIMRKAARDFADSMIARLKVRNIRPSQYANAEVRAAKASDKARKAGDIETAAAEKRNQLVQTYAVKAAYAAQDEINGAIAYLKKFENSGTRQNLDFGYLDQIDAMLERFDLRKGQSLKAIDKRKSLADWITAQRDLGNEPDFSEEMINESFRKSYKDLTVEEFRGVVEAVRQIEHIGRLKKKLLKSKDKREFKAIVADAESSIIKNGGKKRPLNLEAERGFKPWLEGIQAGHRKLASLFRQMDGGKDNGIMYNLLGRTMNEQATEEAVMGEAATLKLNEIYSPLFKLKGGLNGDKQFIPEINNSLTRGGRLSVVLNWGNTANRQRVMDGDQWSEQQVQAIMRRLTPVEAQFVNDIWAYIDTYWEAVAEKQKRLLGSAPTKVEAEPFAMQLADGSVASMRGGYYPLKYDSARDSKTEAHDAAGVAADMKRGAYTKATTRRGHTKERLEDVKKPVRKSLDVITQHIAEVTHDLAWHEWMMDANRILSAKPIDQAIRDHYGPAVIKTIKDNVAAIATADIVSRTKLDQALLYLRSNVSRSTMGLSLTTAFLQPFGLTQSMVRIGPKHVLRGMARWGGDIARFQDATAWIYEKSDFMRLRDKTFNRELNEINGRVNSGKSKPRQIYDASLFIMMQKMQKVADVPTWIGAYDKAKDGGATEEESSALADQAVLDSQGGGQIKDLAELQRKHPMLSMFYSYFNVTYNLAAESTAKTDFKSPAAVAGWMADMMLLMVIPAIGPAMILELLRGGGSDDPEEWAKMLAEWQAGYLLGTVMLLRELSGTVSGFDYAGPPAGRVVTDLTRMGTQVNQGEIDEGFVISAVRLFGSATGIPTVQIIRSWKGWNAWADGDAPPTAILLGPPPPR
jgi:hypothetical protein